MSPTIPSVDLQRDALVLARIQTTGSLVKHERCRVMKTNATPRDTTCESPTDQYLKVRWGPSMHESETIPAEYALPLADACEWDTDTHTYHALPAEKHA